MRVTTPIMNAQGITLEVKGGGKNAFTRFWTEIEGEGEEAHTVERNERMKKSKKFLSYKARVWESPTEIACGDYTIRFSFALPDNIPSSLMFKNKSREAPKCKVKYFAKAVLDCEGEDMKHKTVLCIREKPVALETGNVLKETSEIKTWMCCSQGTSELAAEFNKNVFTPAEHAEGELKINNGNCKIAVSKVTFSIEQVMKQHIGHHTHVDKKTIIKQTCDGPAANDGDWKKTMDLDLSKIKYEVASEKKKKGKTKKISKEDAFAMASLQPACHTKKFSNDYYLCVETEYDGCVCCVDLPDARMRMTIIPMVNPECFGFIPPSDWNP